MVLSPGANAASFIEGLVLGIGGSVGRPVHRHRSAKSRCVGARLRTGTNPEEPALARAAWLWFLGFALTTPVGVVIGMVLVDYEWVDGIVQHTLLALASGFFLYVGLMEIVAKEPIITLGSGLFAVFKLLMLVSGFALMALLGLWV